MTAGIRAPLSLTMRELVHGLLCIFVFTLPWDTILWEGIGALSRVVGIVALGAALVAAAVQGRVRRPNAIFWLAAAFVALNAVSLLWTISSAASTERIWTYTQLLGSVWMVQEFTRTRKERESLLIAFCLGAFIPAGSLLNNFRLGVHFGPSADRFSSGGAFYLNANDIAMTLVIAIPMALHLMQHRGWIVKVMAFMYVVLGSVAILLTGTRTAVLAGIVTLAIAPLVQLRQSARFIVRAPVLLRAACLLVVVSVTMVLVVPQSLWDRISTIPSEIFEGGEMSGRSNIWDAGLRAVLDRPILGFGAAAFGPAVTPLLGNAGSAHNLPLEVLVEEGIVGFSIFVALLAACAFAIARCPAVERKLWAGLMLSWLIGVTAVNLGTSKVTWLLFGLLAAQSASETGRRQIPQPERKRADVAMRSALLPPVHAQRVPQVPLGR
jgi:O-antigen ligase